MCKKYIKEMDADALLFNAMVVIAKKCESKEEILEAFKEIKEGVREDLRR